MNIPSDLISKPSLEDFILFDSSLENIWKAGYNIGDLFNIPSLFDIWSFNNFKRLEEAKKVSAYLPDSILGLYFINHPDNENVPNVERLQTSVQQYIHSHHENLKEMMDFIARDDVLVIHVRSGDKKSIEPKFIEFVHLHYEKFEYIVVLCGIHLDTRFVSNLNIKQEFLIKSLQEIGDPKQKMYIHIGSPDVHLSFMATAKHLLIHRGGFSVLGSILCPHHLYYYTFKDKYWLYGNKNGQDHKRVQKWLTILKEKDPSLIHITNF